MAIESDLDKQIFATFVICATSKMLPNLAKTLFGTELGRRKQGTGGRQRAGRKMGEWAGQGKGAEKREEPGEGEGAREARGKRERERQGSCHGLRPGRAGLAFRGWPGRWPRLLLARLPGLAGPAGPTRGSWPRPPQDGKLYSKRNVF